MELCKGDEITRVFTAKMSQGLCSPQIISMIAKADPLG